MYYYKVAKAYGDITGRGLADYPATDDFEPNVDEFRIVGSLDANPLGISSIRAGNGDGTGNLNIVTITTASKLTGNVTPHNLFIDSPFIINGVTVDGASYNGSYTVKDIVGINTFTFTTSQQPSEFLPNPDEFDTATLSVGSDTVSSASPYIFNCSLRSVYGLNGLWADGSKSTGFKSIVVAQFTGVSLQKDDNSFIIYEDGVYYDNAALPVNSSLRPLHTNSRSIYKPDWENFHIRASNDSFIQCVSVFAIGYAKHFLTESGGDMSITNSNSNFGAISLESVGYKRQSFDRDDVGYITHIIPPKYLESEETSIEYISIDVDKTVSVGNTSKLFLYEYTNESIAPDSVIEGYRIGAKVGEELNVLISNAGVSTQYSARIVMPNTEFTANEITSEKDYTVGRQVGINSISTNVFTLTQNHAFINGETVRVISESGELPDGLDNNQVYYVITTGANIVSSDQIKIAKTFNDAVNDSEITINDKGGILHVVSRVSDKKSGDIGHPVQYDSSNNQWYVNVATASTENNIYSTIISLGTGSLGNATPRTFITRKPDTRGLIDTIYRARFVLPSDS